MVKALSLRVALSVALFLMLMARVLLRLDYLAPVVAFSYNQ